ncbi:MAG: putative transporter [Parachlamydiales bacterium]|nr:putative transporter [Parachlamydiales bacterium]
MPDRFTKKWIAIIVIMMTNGMLWLDATILPVALPTIQSYFHSTNVQLQWMIDTYLVALPIFVVMAGKMGDVHGHRKILSFGIILFALSSLFCGLSQTSFHLIAFRFFQGLGAAMMVPSSTGILFQNTPEKNRGAILGLIAFANSFFMAMGPLVGGFITHYFSWHYIFFVNVPFSLIALFFTLRFLPRSPTIREPIDVLGFLSYGLSLICLTIAIMEGRGWGFASLPVISLFFFFFLFLAILYYVDRKAKDPFISFSLFKITPFLSGLLITFFVSLARGMFIFWPIYFQDVLSLSPLASGALTSASGILNMAAAPFVGKIADKYGSKKPVLIGQTIIILSFFWISYSMFQMNLYLLYPALAAIGLGIILTMVPAYTCAMNSVPAPKRGQGAGLISTFRETGNSLGVAILGSIIVNLHIDRFSSELSQNSDTRSLNPAQFEGLFSKSPATLDAISEMPSQMQETVTEAFRLSYAFAISLTNLVSGLFIIISMIIAIFLFKYKRKQESQYLLEP